MKPLSLDNVVATTEGDFDRLEPGAYACIVQDVHDEPSKEYFSIVLGIAEGPRKGFFDDAFYYDKPWAHSLIMSYKDSALGMLKGRCEVISSWNPGFDAVAAVQAGSIQMLVGRKVGVVFGQEERYDRKAGRFTCEGSARPQRLITREDMKAGKGDDPRPRMMSEERRRRALEAAGVTGYDVERILAQARGESSGASQQAAAQPAAIDDGIPF